MSRPAHPGAKSWTDAQLTLAGVRLPEALFCPDPALQSAFIHVSPVEASFFTTLAADEVARVCAAVTGAEPERRVMRDRYYDTPGGALFAQGVSVRLREYSLHTRPLVFEVIAVSWRGVRPEGRFQARATHVLVQTFGRNTADELRPMLERYRQAGYVQVAEVAKARTAFDVVPVVTETPDGELATAVDHRGIGAVEGELRVRDLGLKVVVDELEGAPFAERTIVEVEYGPRHRRRAEGVVARLREALGGGGVLRAKERNKIAYLLAG